MPINNLIIQAEVAAGVGNKTLIGGGVALKGIPSTATNYWGLASNKGRHLRTKAGMNPKYTLLKERWSSIIKFK
tara:strand:- start:93 stop:314 length:222 start_codon:yes stop_codon:yes gene_type:complete